MAEYERIWAKVPEVEQQHIEGLTIRKVIGLWQYMVSGDLKAAATRAGVNADGVGVLGLASGSRYSVRLARDRLLVVSDEPDLFAQGWSDEGYAVSGMSAALEVLELSGPLSQEIVKRATMLNHVSFSPCAVTLFAGVTTSVYRYGDPADLRLHFDRGLAAFIWNWLAKTIAILQS